jgi:hypothetical protein
VTEDICPCGLPPAACLYPRCKAGEASPPPWSSSPGPEGGRRETASYGLRRLRGALFASGAILTLWTTAALAVAGRGTAAGPRERGR